MGKEFTHRGYGFLKSITASLCIGSPEPFMNKLLASKAKGEFRF
jgi:hypothetical protein